MNTSLQGDFQICISVPLSELSTSYVHLKYEISYLYIYYCCKSHHRQNLFKQLATKSTVEPTFLELLPFEDPYFFKAIILLARAIFSGDTVYWNSQFSTANLVFTVTLFIYHLVNDPGVFKFKIPGDAQITWTKVFHKLAFSRQH